MNRERAKELLKLGSKKADYVRFMTCWETDKINSLGYPQFSVLKQISRGVLICK